MENQIKGSSFSTVESVEHSYFRITFETDSRDKFLRMQQTARDCIDNKPFYELKHGLWGYVGKSSPAAYCNACNRKMDIKCFGYPHCPMCGAIMDGKCEV